MSEAASTMTVPPDCVRAIREARAVVVLTGAGVSAESGIPTFRDALSGLWAKYDPMRLATPEAFAADPQRVTQWYDQRRAACRERQPNAGHVALAQMQQRVAASGGGMTLITQNVDRLHQRAGTHDVIELHGSLAVWRCVDCGERREETGPMFSAYPPRCDRCGGLRRPDVVWFGEFLDAAVMASAHEAVKHCDLFLSVGTSAVVEPAASLVHLARAGGAKTVEVNPEATPISGVVDWSLRGASGRILPALVAALAGPGAPGPVAPSDGDLQKR